MSLLSVRLRVLFLTPILMGFFYLISVLPGYAEWFVAGYGGVSMKAKLTDVTMPIYGERLAADQFPSTTIPTTGDTLTQNFKTSDISMENSPIFGAKVGYFLADPSFKWLGFELDAFTTKRDFKQETRQTNQDITFSPGPTTIANCGVAVNSCPEVRVLNGELSMMSTSLRVSTIAVNVLARYPGTIFQPYVGVGAGAFYFSSSGQFDGRQVVPGLNAQAGLKVLASEEWGLFVEGKYNYATITNLDPVGFGLSGTYNALNVLAGVAYHF